MIEQLVASEERLVDVPEPVLVSEGILASCKYLAAILNHTRRKQTELNLAILFTSKHVLRPRNRSSFLRRISRFPEFTYSKLYPKNYFTWRNVYSLSPFMKKEITVPLCTIAIVLIAATGSFMGLTSDFFFTADSLAFFLLLHGLESDLGYLDAHLLLIRMLY